MHKKLLSFSFLANSYISSGATLIDKLIQYKYFIHFTGTHLDSLGMFLLKELILKK